MKSVVSTLFEESSTHRCTFAVFLFILTLNQVYYGRNSSHSCLAYLYTLYIIILLNNNGGMGNVLPELLLFTKWEVTVKLFYSSQLTTCVPTLSDRCEQPLSFQAAEAVEH